MRDALVAGNGNFRVDPGCSFYAKFHIDTEFVRRPGTAR
jgi:hypothetical protein